MAQRGKRRRPPPYTPGPVPDDSDGLNADSHLAMLTAEPRDRGRVAARAGVPCDANPFPRESKYFSWMAWREGWTEETNAHEEETP